MDASFKKNLLRLCITVAVVSTRAGAQTELGRFGILGQELRIAVNGAWVEMSLRDLPGALPPQSGLVRTLSVLPATAGFRALIHPDTLAHFLDSAAVRISRARARVPPLVDGLRMGELPNFLFQLESNPGPIGPPQEMRIEGCSPVKTAVYLDTVQANEIVASLRRAIDSARAARGRLGRTADPGVACPARPIAGSVVVPTISRTQLGSPVPVETSVDVAVDDRGFVTDVRWPRRMQALAAMDSAIRRWRFEPATGAGGVRRASHVVLRVHFDATDPFIVPDSVTSLRVRAASAGAQFAVIGHILGRRVVRTVTSGGVRLHVEDGGPRIGLPIVIVPGAGTRIEQLEPILEQLRQQRRVIAYDLRGHGRSSPANDYTLAAHRRDLRTVIDALGLDRVLLAGVGVGGVAALELAKRDPGRVLGLALIGPAGDYALEDVPHVSVADSIRSDLSDSGRPTALRRFFPPGDSLILEWIVRDLRATRPDALNGAMNAAAQYDFAQAFAAYAGAKLVMLPSLAPGGVLRRPFATAHDEVVRASYPVGRWLYLASASDVSRALEAFVYYIEWAHR